MSLKSCESYNDFIREVTHVNRYFYSDDVNHFLAYVRDTIKTRETPVELGNIFWRAQLGCELQPIFKDSEEIQKKPVPFKADRMKPDPFKASEGRANPKGLPFLYLASTKETAMAEVRPWRDSFISVGQFKTVKNLRLVNCSGLPSHGDEFHQMPRDEQQKEEKVWADIDKAFSRPVTISDKSPDYVPTQIIAALFKSHGYDGVFYRSALAPDLSTGFSTPLNLALFDIEAAEMLTCDLFSVEKIQFSFRTSSNGYSF